VVTSLAVDVRRLVLRGERIPSPLRIDDGVGIIYSGVADRVELHVLEDRFPEMPPMRKMRGRDIWYQEVPLSPTGRIEYKLGIVRDRRVHLITDPRNPDHAIDPFGANSIASGPEYSPPPWFKAAHAAGGHSPVTRVFPVHSSVFAGTRRHRVYLPPRFDTRRRYDLLLVHDGSDYVAYADLLQFLDHAILSGAIPPVVAALLEPGNRLVEYADDPGHTRHLIQEVIPAARRRFDVGRVIAMGVSLGGVASISAAVRSPGSIDVVVAQSGSFVTALGGRFRRGLVLEPVTRFMRWLLDEGPQLPGRLAFSCGTYDGLVEDTRVFVDHLASQPVDLRYAESDAGHHWHCWRDHLASDLGHALVGAAR